MSGERRPAGSWRVARIGGVDVFIRPSILIFGALVVLVFQDRLGVNTSMSPLILSLLLALFLYAGILIHELAHAAAARALGYPVDAITLHFFGGETAMEGDTRRPWHEAWIAVVGPLASLGVALVSWWLASVTTGDVRVVADLLARINLLLALANLLPGLPLDGGRVLRGLLWAILGNRAAATTTTAWLGRLLGIALVVAVLWFALRGPGRWLDVAVGALVAGFLWLGATGALHRARRERRIARLRAWDLAETDTPSGPGMPELSVELSGVDLLRAMAAEPAEAYRLVTEEGRSAGVLRTAAVDEAYRRSAR